MTDARGEWFREMDQDAVAGDQPDPAPDPPDLRETDYADAPDDIPPRGWLLGNLLCRQFLTGIFGDGATGKTALLVAMALSLATGLALIGEHVFERGRVAVLCFEDGKAELLRRLRAACLHYGIQKSELRGWLFVDAVMAPDLKLAVQARDRLAEGLLSGALSRLIDRRRLDAVLLDPLVKTHQVAENDNTAMDFVSTILAELAVRHDVAIGVAHHTRKGSPDPGNADIGRGGGALKDAFRLCYTQTAMQKEEADRLCISDDERASLVRVDYGKVNLVRRSPDAHWFRLIGVPLGNRTETYPHGDEVQTVVRWTPPDVFADTSDAVLNRILEEIDKGMENGRRYTNANNATDRAAWQVVARHLERDKRQARAVVRTWIDNGVLVVEDYDDPVEHKTLKGLRLDPTKRPGPQ